MTAIKRVPGAGNSVLIYKQVFLPGEWDWRIKSELCASGLYQLPEEEHWTLVGVEYGDQSWLMH